MIFLDASVLLASFEEGNAQRQAALVLMTTRLVGTIDLAVYEAANIADLQWGRPDIGIRVRDVVWQAERFGKLVRVDRDLIDAAARVAAQHHISVYDATYVAGARRVGWQLVSCDVRDLVSKGLARLPADVLADG